MVASLEEVDGGDVGVGEVEVGEGRVCEVVPLGEVGEEEGVIEEEEEGESLDWAASA